MLLPVASEGQIVVSAQHRIIATTENYRGENEITIELSITNNTSLNMGPVELRLVEPYFSRSDPLVIERLNAGTTQVINWLVTTPYSVDAVAEQIFLSMVASVVDGEGRYYEMDVVSQVLP